jgi:mono/diheme cytochrome c family protein
LEYFAMNSFLPRTLLAAGLGLVHMGAALADGGRAMPRMVPPAYTQECASCHTAYPPGMLPARSWERVMGGLDRHYGTDASLDAATVQQLSAWLQSNAGASRRVAEEPPQDRITRSAWFEREHRKVEPAVWKLPSVKSAANCAACHAGAEQGRFDEDDLRLPAGMTPRQRWGWGD